MTDGEKKLWAELRQFRRWYGIHVRRQVPIGGYVADFAIHSHKLVIEVDGEHHFTVVGHVSDSKRDNWFAKEGYRVLRFNTGELDEQFDGCVTEILGEVGLMGGDGNTPTPDPSPQGGGERHRPGQLVIRPASVDDLPACAAIINDYIDATEWLPRVKTRREIAGFFTPELLASRTVLVAEVEGRIAAYLSVSHEGFVYALYLAPPFRGQGIGRLLLDHAKQMHPDRLELTVFEPNAAARRFYEREGFGEVPEGRKIEEEGIPILLMRWSGAA